MLLCTAVRKKVEIVTSFFTSDTNVSLQWQMDLEKELGEALKSEQLEVKCTPLISNGKILTDLYWACFSWNTDKYGLISSSEFCAVAKQALLVSQLDYLLLEKAIKYLQLCGNKRASILMPLSYLLFSHHDFVRGLKAALVQHQLSGARLIFVITGEPWLRDGVAQGEVMG
jgi:diguanylate cyclase